MNGKEVENMLRATIDCTTKFQGHMGLTSAQVSLSGEEESIPTQPRKACSSCEAIVLTTNDTPNLLVMVTRSLSEE